MFFGGTGFRVVDFEFARGDDARLRSIVRALSMFGRLLRVVGSSLGGLRGDWRVVVWRGVVMLDAGGSFLMWSFRVGLSMEFGSVSLVGSDWNLFVVLQMNGAIRMMSEIMMRAGNWNLFGLELEGSFSGGRCIRNLGRSSG